MHYSKNVTLLLALGCVVLGGSSLAGQSAMKTQDLHSEFAPLPGKVIGVLRTDFGKDIQSDGGTAPPDAVGFTSGQAKERLIYCPCATESDNCQTLTVFVGMDGKQRKCFASVELLTAHSWPSILKEKSHYRLVEAEVNDGLGSPRSDFFVATRIVPRDGTDFFPERLDPIVDKLTEEFKYRLGTQGNKIEQWLEKARVAAIGSTPASGPRETATRLFITWIAEKQHVLVDMRQLVTDGDYHYASGVGKKGASQSRLRYGMQFGVEIHAQFAIERNGAIHEAPVAWRTTKKELPPPN